MSHLDEGLLQAHIDGELRRERADDVERHLDGCTLCRERLNELRERAGLVREVLSHVDHGAAVEDLDAARWEVRRRWAARRSEARRRMLGRAAAVLLVASGVVATAVPDSPVRALVSEGWTRIATALGGDPADEGPPSVALESEREEEPAPDQPARIAANAGPEGLDVLLTGVREGTEIGVSLVPGSRGGVTADGGARFLSAEGRVEAEVEAGPVRVELPSDAPAARLLVEGRVLAEVRDGRLEAPGIEPEEWDDQELRFRFR